MSVVLFVNRMNFYEIFEKDPWMLDCVQPLRTAALRHNCDNWCSVTDRFKFQANFVDESDK